MTFNFHQDVIGFFMNQVSEEDVQEYKDDLMRRFQFSPEGQAYLMRDDIQALMWAEMFTDFSIDYLSRPLWLLHQHDVRKILYDIFPEKIMTLPDDAQEIVDELRAFWEFINREFKEKNAKTILKVLNEKNIVKRLTKELGDGSKYGMTKSVMMPALEAGIDFSDEAAIQQYIEKFNAGLQAEIAAPPPKKIIKKRDEVIRILKPICEEHLKEYLDFALLIVDIMSQVKPVSPLKSGQAKSWAAGIIYALGKVNFLSDPSHQPYLSSTELCKLFGVAQSTASAKAKIITDGLGLIPFHPEWTIASLQDENLLIWMVETSNGLIEDIRNMPREVQEQAFEDGIIPYIPDDKDKKK